VKRNCKLLYPVPWHRRSYDTLGGLYMRPMRILPRLITPVLALGVALVASSSVAPVGPAWAGDGAAPVAGPTAENALAAEQEIARAIRDNDADAIQRLLADDWAVIPTTGSIAEGKSIFPDGIRSGYLTRKTFELSEPRVRVHGSVAVITTKVRTSGMLNGKFFDVIERQTDVLQWEHGGWKSVLTHETKIAPAP
jgi:ketosteroid isomerase-like protein